MAGDYISREAALMKLMQDGCSAKNLQSISDMPAADVAPVVRGVWDIMEGTKTRRVCSKCGWDVPEYGKFFSYCPNCGAKMDGGGEK